MKRKDNSIWYFLFPLIVGAVLLIFQCFTMANAANVVDQVPKLIDRATPADSLFATSDVLHAELFDSLIVVTMRVGDKIITDTIWGPGDTTRVLGTMFSDTVRVGGRAYFGWAGHSIFLDSALVDSMVQQTGRFSPGGAGSGDIEGVTAGSGLSGGGVSGTVTVDIKPGWGLYIHDDSIKIRYNDLLDSLGSSGTDEDSTFIAHRSSRWLPLPDSTPQYVGSPGDSSFLRFNGSKTETNTDDWIISFVKIYYGENVVDSALVTWGSMMAQVGATGSGDITGVITSPPLTGGAALGDVSLGIDWTWLYGFNDTMSAKVDSAAVADSALASARTRLLLGPQGSANTAGRLTADSIDVDTLSTSRLSFDAGGAFTSLLGTGLSNTAGALTATLGTAITSDEITDDEIAWADMDSVTGKNAIRDIAHDTMWANTPGYLTSETGDISNVGVTAPITGGGSSGSVTIAFDWTWLWAFNDSMTAIVPRATLADSTNGGAIRSEVTKTVAHPWLYAYIDTSRARIPASDTAYAVLHSWLYGYIDTSTATIPRATLADSTSGGAARAEAAKLAYRLTAPQGSANTFGRMVGDSIDVDSIHAGRISVGTDASITDITGDGLAIAAGALTASLGTAITSGEITDGTIALGDMGSNSVDSTKITDGGIGSGDIGTGRITTTHVLDNTLAAADIATGGVATAEILDQTIVLADVDSTGHLAMNNARVNGILYADTINSGAGLTITSSILLGTDITDDTTVVDFYPEPSNVVLANSLMPQYNDSIKIYGVIDSLLGNTLHFRDSTLNTHGLRRRGFQMTVSHPMRVDSLRYVIIEGLVKDSSASNEMYLKGMLRTTTFTTSCLDSNAAANIKDYDSLGGDWGDVAAIRRFVLTGGAVTPGTPWYLLITARHDSGTAWNWAEVWRIRFVYSRTRL